MPCQKVVWNTDRIDIEERKHQKKGANEPLPSVRSTQDEDTEVSKSLVGAICCIFRETILVSLSIRHACSSALLVKMWQMTSRLIHRNRMPLNKVNAIRNVRYQQCLFPSILFCNISKFRLSILSKGNSLCPEKKRVW